MDTALFVDGAKHVGCILQEQHIKKLETYHAELAAWNRKINLTGLNRSLDITASLFIDSLAFSPFLPVHDHPTSVIDIGTGAGFPGVPLKIVNPALEMTLVEPNLKKVAFLHHIIGTLDLANTTVISNRIEELTHTLSHQKKFDIVLTKALNFLPYLPYLHPLINATSHVVLWRSSPLDPNHDHYGFKINREISYTLPYGFGSRVLTVLIPT